LTNRSHISAVPASIYDDAYGVVTEADLIAEADEAFQTYDRAEAEPAKRQTR
jgi:hypothetical protein